MALKKGETERVAHGITITRDNDGSYVVESLTDAWGASTLAEARKVARGWAEGKK